VGTDTDPLAVKAAARNAELNGCAPCFVSLRCSPHLADPEPVQEVSHPVTGNDKGADPVRYHPSINSFVVSSVCGVSAPSC
jgi:hypothetical protein